MENKILAHASIKDVSMIGNICLSETQKAKLKKDDYLEDLLNQLREELQNLHPALSQDRTKPLTKEFLFSLQEFSDRLTALRYFVRANQYDPDADVREAAQKVGRLVFKPFKRNSIAAKQSRAQVLIEKLKTEQYSKYLDQLTGVKKSFQQFEEYTNLMIEQFRLRSNTIASKEKVIPGHISARNIRELLNHHIFPYIETMSKAKPDEFYLLHNLLKISVRDLNQSIRLKRKRNAEKRKQINEQNDAS